MPSYTINPVSLVGEAVFWMSSMLLGTCLFILINAGYKLYHVYKSRWQRLQFVSKSSWPSIVGWCSLCGWSRLARRCTSVSAFRFPMITYICFPMSYDHTYLLSDFLWSHKSAFRFPMITQICFPMSYDHTDLLSDFLWSHRSAFRFPMITQICFPISYYHTDICAQRQRHVV